LPKNLMVDRLRHIAAAHGFFGQQASGIEINYWRLLRGNPGPNFDGGPAADIIAAGKVGAATYQPSRQRPKAGPAGFGFGRAGFQRASWCCLVARRGLGKSQLAAFISAVVSNGGTWPCGEGSTLPGDVVFMSAEDGIRDTIVPRLMAAGANTSRVHIVRGRTAQGATPSA
jgi:putative DNA primase/helicase